MKESKTLYEIKEAEQKAKKLVEQARKDKEDLVAKARADSIRLIDQKEAEIERLSKENLEKAERTIIIERQELASKNKAEVKASSEAAKKNVTKAVDFVLVQFKEEVQRC